ncbi:MAG TPA: YccF domain-containing protein [Verrucomicrobiae bacterium]|nr:YccF domain-containing protein [Verrucomicrobiae bacterium]
MQPVSFIMNLLWLVLGGIVMGLGWFLAGVIMAITIIGLPWARSCFVIARLAFWPFGKVIVDRQQVQGHHDGGTGLLGLLGNVIWFLVAGWWLAIGHIGSALANFVTIIGIPFGIQHLKLAVISLAPVGKTVTEK